LTGPGRRQGSTRDEAIARSAMQSKSAVGENEPEACSHTAGKPPDRPILRPRPRLHAQSRDRHGHQAVLRPLSNIRRLSLPCLCLLVHRDTYSLTMLASWSWQTCTAAPLSIRGAPTRHSGIAGIAPCKADTRLGSHNMPQPRSPARLFICAFMPRNELLPVPCALLSSGVVGAPFTIP